MLSNRGVQRCVLCTTLLVCWAGTATAGEVCPKQPRQALRFVDVFDGPPEEMASLVPDQAKARAGHWKVDYIYDAGRFVTVRCKYADSPTIDVRLPDKVHRCEYTINANKVLSVRCK